MEADASPNTIVHLDVFASTIIVALDQAGTLDGLKALFVSYFRSDAPDE